MALLDDRGRLVVLGARLGRGGEGTVYAVEGTPDVAAKVYTRPPDARRERKLVAMVSLARPQLAAVAAWPTSPLRDAASGALAGFLMPRLRRHHPVHSIYGPSARRRVLPGATWRLLVRCSRNLAAAFDIVHRHGHVVGDVNEANVLVSARALVRLIDCDSFQVQDGAALHLCEVGVPLCTPPELLAGGVAGRERTRHHDGFGLAVLVFRLLFTGRHPFAGCRPGNDLTVESAVREGAFAYGKDAARAGWSAPPHSLRLSELPAAVAALFEAAFGPEAAAGAPRPSAAEWVAALDTVEAQTTTCPADASHEHAAPVGSCPWCRIEEAGGPSLFGPPHTAYDRRRRDLERAWHAIVAVPSPGPAGPPPGPAATARRSITALLCWPTPVRLRPFLAGTSATFALVSLACGQPLGGLGLLGLWALRPPARRRRERAVRRRAVLAEMADLQRLQALWPRQCGDGGFARRLERLTTVRSALEALPQLEEQERRLLLSRVRRLHRRRHLARHRLHEARLPGLGEAELARLRGHGIGSAAEVDAPRLARVQGLDPRLTRSLLEWARQLAAGFQADAVRVGDEERRALDQRQRRRRLSLARSLRVGAADLAQCREAVLQRRLELRGEIQRAAVRIAALRSSTPGSITPGGSRAA